MLRLTFMATCCIILDILDTYAQKHSSEELPADLRARLSANAKGERIEDPLRSADTRPPSSRLSIPLIDAFNPFEPPQNQIAAAKDASNQLADWLQRLRTDLLRPFSLPGTSDAEYVGGAAISPVQTHPQASNVTHLGEFTESRVFKTIENGKELREIANTGGFGLGSPNSPIISEKINNDGAEGGSLQTSTSFALASTDRVPRDVNSTGATETIDNYYDGDLGLGKIPEAEESDEVTAESDSTSNSNSLERKFLQTGFDEPIQKRILQIKNAGNTTQDLYNDVKELIATMNLSQAQSAVFVEVIGKIVEEELKRRLEAEGVQAVKLFEATEKPKLAGIKLHAPDNEVEKDLQLAESIDGYPEIQPGNLHEDEIRPYEKLTANTRLSFDERRIIDDYHNAQDEVSGALTGGTSRLDFGREVRKKVDYKVREQAEYDRLISGVTEATPGFGYAERRTSRGIDPTLARMTTAVTANLPNRRIVSAISPPLNQDASTGSSNTSLPQQPVKHPHPLQRTTIVHGKVGISETVTSSPRTAFERQAEDFRSRLLGNNGFGDIMKALEHANIGFYERHDFRN